MQVAAGVRNTIPDLTGAAPSVHHGHMPEIEITGPDTASGIWAMEDLLTFPAGKDAPGGTTDTANTGRPAARWTVGG
ncbi:nuclear transport factor 2 family protein [Streptomyces sp. PRKS01-29]|nr:nuclear transport factor 2 family protein [Streptomyces sabulosicollis]